MFSFVYAWIGFSAVYNYLKNQYEEKEGKDYPTKLNLTTVTVMLLVLFIVFAAGFGLLLFN